MVVHAYLPIQVASIKQEFDNLIERQALHPGLLRYVAMRHEVTENSIIVEVGGLVGKLLLIWQVLWVWWEKEG